jgi:hypothetical protein
VSDRAPGRFTKGARPWSLEVERRETPPSGASYHRVRFRQQLGSKWRTGRSGGKEWVEGDVILAADGVKSRARSAMIARLGEVDEGKL